MEVFTIIGRNKQISIQSNRPLLRNKSLNKTRIKWKVVNGKVNYISALERVIKEIESVIKFVEHPPFDFKNHPKKFW